MIDTLLVLNAGSSSLKFQVFALSDLAMLAGGQVSRIGGEATFKASLASGEKEAGNLAPGTDHTAALAAVLEFVDRHDDGWRVAAVVHRIVHGGTQYVDPVFVTPEVMDDLAALSPLAPLHQPHNLAAITASEALVGDVPDIACFDTAFHANREDLFTTFAISGDLRAKGVRRYGFHGISYQWIARVLAEEHPRLAAGRVVAAHLGNGASLCAIERGRSVDTTMGMTALDGLPMGTRCGAIDAGAVIYMLRDLGMSTDEAEAELYNRSGLLGLSGLTNDVRELLASAEPSASLALDYYALKVAQHSAMMAASMGGIDALVFTAGIGEHATLVREAILARLGFLGAFETLVIPANEELMMAIDAKALLEASA
ncbi:acetate/propionate family kinase [Arvimicrobium flavum]|uniref:acetate/propionate family kinase n=1 Tax=Arvimicrobium flavum TaxID=3393320 RepID=UPI00237B874F|nr:acetate/propionate family kinase [Mesorhizobium shangrilense]